MIPPRILPSPQLILYRYLPGLSPVTSTSLASVPPESLASVPSLESTNVADTWYRQTPRSGALYVSLTLPPSARARTFDGSGDGRKAHCGEVVCRMMPVDEKTIPIALSYAFLPL